MASYLEKSHGVSITRACRTIGLSKCMYYYTSIKDDSEVIEKLHTLAQDKPARGFPYYYRRIRNEGLEWNHKRVKRVYDMLKLNLRRKHKRRLPGRFKVALCSPTNANQTWSMDFMHDTLSNGRKVRVLNIIDDYNREALAIQADYSHSGSSVASTIEQIIDWRGKPCEIRCDNGPEFLSHTLVDFCNNHNIKIKYIQPGKPTQNAYIERFNRSFREDILDAYLFESMDQLRELAMNWMQDYNQLHPHQSLNNMSPLKYLEINQHI
ncbi:MAG: IS3 family transposase [Bacteroidia bacterium]|nr:IS3 family transposase [Bacteroidia bacterium]